MKRIELTGTTGVGKTTFYNLICSTPGSGRSYITQKEAWILAAMQNSVPVKQIRLYLLHKVLKTGIVRKRRYGLAKRILNIKKNRMHLISRDEYLNYRISFEIIYKSLLNEPNPYVVLFKLKYFLNKVDEFLIFNRLLSGNFKILVDEGLMHRVTGLRRETFSQYNTDDIKADNALNPAGIIYCEQSAEAIYGFCRERKKRGEIRFSTDHMSDDELKQFIEKSIHFQRSKMKFCEMNGIPVLRINPTDDLQSNLNLVDSFIKEL